MRAGVTAEALHARLLAGPTATEAIEDLFGTPVRVLRLPGGGAVTPEALSWLQPAAGEAVAHRRVRLLAGDLAVSEADIWYMPARLWPGMAAMLAETDTPFGRIVSPMQPSRETVRTRFGLPGAAYALELEAVVRDGRGVPIAVVAERYLIIDQVRG